MAMKIAKIDVEWDSNIQYCKYDLMDLGFILGYYKAQKPSDQRSFWIFLVSLFRKLIKWLIFFTHLRRVDDDQFFVGPGLGIKTWVSSTK